MTILNRGESDAHAGGLSPPDAAATAEIREVVMDGDVMQMQPLPDGLLNPCWASYFVTLQPGGYHIMLMGLGAAALPPPAMPCC
jgi:copper(I)-binding protein